MIFDIGDKSISTYEETIKTIRLEEPTSLPTQGEEENIGQDVSVGETLGGDGQVESTKEEIKSYIKDVFISSGSDAVSWANDICDCESGFNALAFNPSGASGIFQFMPSTFYGNGGVDIWDWREQVDIAHRMFDAGQRHQWECSYLVYGY